MTYVKKLHHRVSLNSLETACGLNRPGKNSGLLARRGIPVTCPTCLHWIELRCRVDVRKVGKKKVSSVD